MSDRAQPARVVVPIGGYGRGRAWQAGTVDDAMPVALAGRDVLTAASAAAEVLRNAMDVDWSIRIPGLDFTVATVVAHAAQGALWYAVDIWGDRLMMQHSISECATTLRTNSSSSAC